MITNRNLNLSSDKETVDSYDFAEPIQGYPTLRWRGKRPFRSTRYYPAQLKEVFGQEVNGWRNKLYRGDNLQVMSHLLKAYRGKIDLVYIDPPFDSRADYQKKIQLKGKKVANDRNAFEEKQYTDLWKNDEYLQFMYERFILLRELLSGNGSIIVHCDWRKSHHLRCLLDEVFGPESFQAHIIWRTMTSSGYKGKSSLGRSHADLLYYTKSAAFTYNPIYKEMSEEMHARYHHTDPDGRQFKDSYLGDVTPETIEELRKENLLYVTSTGGYRIKHYLDEAKGTLVDNIWTDINPENSQSSLLTDYPTQKPEALLERIITFASNPGGLILDCFMGSGTTQAVAMKTGRRVIGADINEGAIQTTMKRLAGVSDSLAQGSFDVTRYTGFEVYNVNQYGDFRNPLEAKEIIIGALEIQPLVSSASSIYDGEKDGRMVKIMPTDRIATRADLNELIAGFDYKTFERRQAESPNRPVEKLLLVCMGHEPDLAAHLRAELHPFKIDVEVVDIRRDESRLEFKRSPEALLTVKKGNLVIERFYPMNLLQKLSMMKEDVNDWRELVESVLVDWNYDGAVLTPSVVDAPGDDEMVSGSYPITKEAGTIRVKITDLLSESWEGEIRHG
jgi:DNA modification methylase